MGWLVGQLLGDVWPYLAAGAVAVVVFLGSYLSRKRNARQRAENDALRGHIKTRERIDNAPHTSDPDTARDRLRRRDPRKP